MNTDQTSWELVIPCGVCKVESKGQVARPRSLEGKTIGLYWHRKPGGKEMLNEIARLVSQKVKNVEFIKYWEQVPETTENTGFELGEKTIQDMASFKPDIVISAQGD